MIAAALQVSLLAAGALPGWAGHLEAARVGAPPPAALARGAERIRSSEPRGLVRGLIDTGLLAAWNRVGATPRAPSGALDPDRAAEVLRGRGPLGSWALALDADGRLTAALFHVPVPVDPSADPAGGFSPRRLRRLRTALDALGRHRLRASRHDSRGNAFGWRGTHPGGRLDVRYDPARDRLTILLYRS